VAGVVAADASVGNSNVVALCLQQGFELSRKSFSADPLAGGVAGADSDDANRVCVGHRYNTKHTKCDDGALLPDRKPRNERTVRNV
jgi:hypothetical protein